jgi:hypothetical protein
MPTSRTARRIALTVVLAAVFAALPAASLAPAATSARFSASFTGTLDVLLRPSGPQVVAWATGTGTGLGKSVLLATGPSFLGLTTPVGACPEFSGVLSITAANGDKLFATIARSKGCRTSVNTFRSSGKVRLLGGTGRFLKASGELNFTARSNVNGNYSLTIAGTL